MIYIRHKTIHKIDNGSRVNEKVLFSVDNIWSYQKTIAYKSANKCGYAYSLLRGYKDSVREFLHDVHGLTGDALKNKVVIFNKLFRVASS